MLIKIAVQNIHAPFTVVKLILDITSHRIGRTIVAHMIVAFRQHCVAAIIAAIHHEYIA